MCLHSSAIEVVLVYLHLFKRKLSPKVTILHFWSYYCNTFIIRLMAEQVPHLFTCCSMCEQVCSNHRWSITHTHRHIEAPCWRSHTTCRGAWLLVFMQAIKWPILSTDVWSKFASLLYFLLDSESWHTCLIPLSTIRVDEMKWKKKRGKRWKAGRLTRLNWFAALQWRGGGAVVSKRAQLMCLDT